MKFAFMTFVVVSYPVFFMILSGDNLPTIVAHVLFIIPVAAPLGPVSALMCELFLTKVRYDGLSLSRNMAAGLSGVLVPLICTTTIKITVQETLVSFYMIFRALIGLVAISRRLRTRRYVHYCYMQRYMHGQLPMPNVLASL